MDVSENSGFPTKIIHFNRVFHDKLCILGYPYFWKHPYMYSCIRRDEKNYIKQTLRVSTLQNISEFHAKYTHNLTAKETDTIWYTHHIEYNVFQPSQSFLSAICPSSVQPAKCSVVPHLCHCWGRSVTSPRIPTGRLRGKQISFIPQQPRATENKLPYIPFSKLAW